jgi:hypothetical protein
VVVDTCRLSRFEDPRNGILTSQRNASADWEEVFSLTRAGQHHRAPIVLVAHHPDLLRAKQLSDLLSDRGKYLRLRRFARDERRHAAQSDLLPHQPRHLCARLGVGDRRADQIRELRNACLGVRREWARLLRVDGQGAPDPARHDDRATNRGAHAHLVANERRDRAGLISPVVPACGSVPLRDHRRRIAWVHLPAIRKRREFPHSGPGGHRDDVAVLETDHPREIGT